MPAQLCAVEFTRELLDLVRDFDCGDEPYQRELAAWLVQEAVPAMARGAKVWLHANEANDVVGFSSLGLTRWKYPESNSPKTGLLIIPAVAVSRCFWGKPDGPPEDRFSSQIMRHLLTEAFAWPGCLPALGLFVHPDNQAAIKLYERFGFRPFHHTYTDRESAITYPSMIRFLLRG